MFTAENVGCLRLSVVVMEKGDDDNCVDCGKSVPVEKNSSV